MTDASFSWAPQVSQLRIRQLYEAAVNVVEGSRDSIVDMLDDLFSAENRAPREALWRRRLVESVYGRGRNPAADYGAGDRT